MGSQTFGGCLKGMANEGWRQARSVVLYMAARTDRKSRIRERIRAACEQGKIDAECQARLLGYLDECHAEFVRRGRMVDERDGRDWKELGNGGRMRRVHKEVN